MSSGTAARARSRRSLAQIPHRNASEEVNKENITVDFSAVDKPGVVQKRTFGKDKKSRSKSLGPGGLDALKNGSGNRRQSTAAIPLKSILKPSVPVSPISHIPSFAETRRKTPSRSPSRASQNTSNNNDLLIDFSTPTSAPVVGTDNLANPFDGFNPSFAPPDNQQVTTKEKGEKERMEQEKKAILEQRAARRKSMANRRVSFAPEATLHTWNVVELMDDSTTSSASANSTRRASSLAENNIDQTSDASEPPSTPEHFNQQSGQQQQQHQSHASTGLEDAADEMFSSSPFSGSSAMDNDDTGVPDANAENDSGSLSSGPDDESTAMSMDNVTEHSLSPHSNGSTTSSSTRLDRSLKMAAKMAGTRGIDDDENADLSMEFTSHEIVGAFQPWIKKGANSDFDAENLSSRLDQENIVPLNKTVGGPSQMPPSIEDDGDMSMEITKSVGGIVPGRSNIPVPSGRNSSHKFVQHEHRDTLRRVSAVTSNLGDQTMEFTNVLGGITQAASPSKESDRDTDVGSDEEMTMEFTSALGGVISKPVTDDVKDDIYRENLSYADKHASENTFFGFEDDMDMTSAVGGILPPIEERTEPSEDGTMGMEMTNALGKILAPYRSASGNGQGETDAADLDTDQLPSSPFQENISASPAKLPLPQHHTVVASENGSPIRSRSRMSTDLRLSPSPQKKYSRQSTLSKSPSTPLKRHNTRSVGPSTPTTPKGSPPRRKSRSASPPKRPNSDLRQSATKSTPIPLFQRNAKTGESTPTFLLRATNSSGIGIDMEGLGSPRVAEILDRRRSIGDDAQEFVPQPGATRGVRFDDPRKLEQEISHETDEDNRDEAKEDPEKDATFNLRELISSLTPKKNKLKGRKSLHVGAARGILGKRPAELDIEDDDDDDHTPKRLRGREASPVKSIKLPAPPSKTETVGRTNHLSMRNVENISPSKNVSTTPKQQPPQSGDLLEHNSDDAGLASEREFENEDSTHADVSGQPIKLSEFLEMTNIRFMELTTTKRRHTTVPGSAKRRSLETLRDHNEKEISLEDCVAAGFCTVPMLELYQHSCRELKSYISEGRRIIRSIEAETYAENPPLFQEYVTAPPDIRLLMDNQFRNVKTHARLLSKSMWYEWRMKLLEGLKQGLDRHVDEMKQDESILSKKEKLLATAVPSLVERHAKLDVESRNLQKVVEEIENCDQEELRSARERLLNIEAELTNRKKQYENAQENLAAKSKIFEEGAASKEKLLQEIRDAERIKEECRGWNVREVRTLQASVKELEKQTGWAVLSATRGKGSPALSLRHSGELRLDFHTDAFRASVSKADNEGRRVSQDNNSLPLTVTYSPGHPQSQPRVVKPAPEIALIIHAMRMRVSHLKQISISPKAFLGSVAKSWSIARSLREEIRLLGYCGITSTKSIEPYPSEPTLLKVRCIILGRIKKNDSIVDRSKNEEGKKSHARVDVDFTVKPRNFGKRIEDENSYIDVDVDASACRVYGFEETGDSQMSDAWMSEILAKVMDQRGQSQATFGHGLWRAAVKNLEEKVFC